VLPEAAAAVELFSVCHHLDGTGMGGLNIKWVHLPHPGLIVDQSWKVKQIFDVVRAAFLKLHADDMKAKG
jgi:hypothetical protein